ncbi:hypothetical protein AVEN_196455-1 [Araneus ventricosus]|uniref:Uncharacterized protein n=1 Tax=Araneus ventricosus TaxID=182803 RepID=A0A4Y2AVU3_ARAVE|nr:hypothetical protein AVEN_196455-1 [Araneus ventricosus]
MDIFFFLPFKSCTVKNLQFSISVQTPFSRDLKPKMRKESLDGIGPMLDLVGETKSSQYLKYPPFPFLRLDPRWISIGRKENMEYFSPYTQNPQSNGGLLQKTRS